MLTGRPAFPAPTEFAKMTAVLTTEPEPLERVDPSLAAFGPFLVRALKKDRGERFGSALEMARALSSVSPGLGQQPLSRLPDVGAIFAPSSLPGPAGPSSPTVPQGPGPSTVAAAVAPVPDARPARGVGDTLSSAASVGLVAGPAPTVVEVVEPPVHHGTTLQSEDLPVLERGPPRRGVAAAVVVALVMGALVAGFLLGWTFARA
jgi:serine/threonine-protein kinase